MAPSCLLCFTTSLKHLPLCLCSTIPLSTSDFSYSAEYQQVTNHLSYPVGSYLNRRSKMDQSAPKHEVGQEPVPTSTKPPTKVSRQRFKPQLSCTLCRARKCVYPNFFRYPLYSRSPPRQPARYPLEVRLKRHSVVLISTNRSDSSAIEVIRVRTVSKEILEPAVPSSTLASFVTKQHIFKKQAVLLPIPKTSTTGLSI